MTVIVVLKGYPRLSETFIAQELRALERHGLDLRLVSLRRPTDRLTHPIHGEVRAPVRYLPEYLHDAPLTVLGAWWRARSLPGYRAALRVFFRDLWRAPDRHRLRRFGQALVLAAEIDDRDRWIHAHFLHTPCSVARYAAIITRRPLSASAHARDIWTTADWDLRDKLNDARFVAVCSQSGRDRLVALAPHRAGSIALIRHGLDFERFPLCRPRPSNADGAPGRSPVRLLCVGRFVAKKGHAVLLDALARLPPERAWRLCLIGTGPLEAALRAQADRLGLGARLDWRGALAQPAILAAYREADLMVLASRIDGDGDRDGLPNVLVEAQSQGLACVASDVGAIGELITDAVNGSLVPPDDPVALAGALDALITDPARRFAFAEAGCAQVGAEFDFKAGIDRLVACFPAAEQKDGARCASLSTHR